MQNRQGTHLGELEGGAPVSPHRGWSLCGEPGTQARSTLGLFTSSWSKDHSFSRLTLVKCLCFEKPEFSGLLVEFFSLPLFLFLGRKQP